MVIHLFGDRLKELRKERNLTQEDIGNLCNVAKNTVSSWEKNINQPNFEIVKKLAQYFGVSIDFLFGYNINNINTIEKINQTLREANLINNDEELKEEEIKLALEQARQYKQMWKKINDLPSKYPNHIIKEEKDTNC